MDLLTNLLMTWIGIDPVKRTLGGWGYKSVAEFFIQHTSLTKKETSKFSMNVKYQFEGMFGQLSPHEKAHLIETIIQTYPLTPECPHRTQQLLDKIYYIYLELKKSNEDKMKGKYLELLKLKELTTKEALSRAFKEQISLNHPDKVSHLSDDIKKLAEEKSKAINDAYNYLVKLI